MSYANNPRLNNGHRETARRLLRYWETYPDDPKTTRISDSFRAYTSVIAFIAWNTNIGRIDVRYDDRTWTQATQLEDSWRIENYDYNEAVNSIARAIIYARELQDLQGQFGEPSSEESDITKSKQPVRDNETTEPAPITPPTQLQQQEQQPPGAPLKHGQYEGNHEDPQKPQSAVSDTTASQPQQTFQQAGPSNQQQYTKPLQAEVIPPKTEARVMGTPSEETQFIPSQGWNPQQQYMPPGTGGYLPPQGQMPYPMATGFPSFQTPPPPQMQQQFEAMLINAFGRLLGTATPGSELPNPGRRFAAITNIQQRYGVFWPDADSKYGREPIFHDRETPCYRDVDLWLSAIEAKIVDPHARDEVFREWQSLLRGKALSWWEYHLGPVERNQYKAQGWFGLQKGLRARFGPTQIEAIQWVVSNKFTVEKIGSNKDIRLFAQDCFKYGRAWLGSSTPQQQLLTIFYNALDPSLQRFLHEPTLNDTVESYLRLAEEKRGVIRRYLQTPIEVLHTTAPDSEDNALWGEPRPAWNNRNQEKRDFPQLQRDQPQWQQKKTQPNWKQQNWKDRKPWNAQQKFPNSRRFARYNRPGQPPNDAKFVWEDESDEDMINHLVDHGYILEDVVEVPAAQPQEEEVAHTGWTSDVAFRAHEATTPKAEIPPPSPQIQEEVTVVTTACQTEPQTELPSDFAGVAVKNHEIRELPKLAPGQIIDAQTKPNKRGMPSKRTHLRLHVKADDNSEPDEVCIDTGASTILVEKSWVTRFARKSSFRAIEPRKMNAVDSTFQVTEEVTFDFYVPGKIGETDVNAHVIVTAGVVNMLGANLLLGTPFCEEHGLVVDFNKSVVKFRSVFNMEAPVEYRRQTPPARRVDNAYAVTIPRKSQVFVPGRYSPLPRDSNDGSETWHFHPTHEAAIYSTVDLATPALFLIHNKGNSEMRIPKGRRIGHLTKQPPGDTSILLSDLEAENEQDNAIFNITNEESTPEGSTKPWIDEIPDYGISKPDDVPMILSKHGVEIRDFDKEFAQQLRKILDRYDIYHNKGIIPLPDEERMRIDLVDGWQNQKTNIKVYPLGLEDLAVLDETYGQLHTEGKMDWADGKPIPIACPLFIVWRQTETARKPRVVADLRPLNRLAVPDVYPLPDQDDIMNAIRGKKRITLFDATGFFHQLPIHSKHRNRMAVISPRGIEISNVVLMGFKNSPAYAQRFMDRIFQDHKHFVRAYIDDIVIFSDTDENHLKHVETVLNIINNNRLNIAAKKSFAGFPSVKLLGHIVDGQGIRRTDDRIAAFKNLRFPKNLSDLEKYLGMAGWLRKDIPWYDVIAAPLNERKTELAAILRKEDQLPTGLNRAVRTKRFQRTTFEPTLEETEAWETLQKNLCDQVVRYHHNPEKPLFFKIDACKGGFGLMVFQMDITWDGVGIPGKDIPQKHIQPVLFLSKVTSPTEKRYFATEAEVAAVVWAVRKLRKLVQSNRNPVQILTDHAATKGILTHTSLRTMDLNKANLRLASAANYLSQFNLNVTHVPGKLNVVPDALSRLPLLVATGRADPFEESDVLADIHDDENIAAFNSEDDERLGEPGGFTIGIGEDFAKTIVENYEADPKYGKLIQQLKRQQESGDEWWSPKEADDEENRARNERRTPIRRRISPWQLSETGFLFHRAYDGTKRLCIPRKAVVEVLSLAHDQKHHFGVDRMLAELASFQIRNKRSVVKRYIAYCPRCKENQVDRQRPPGSLQPIPVVGIPFDTVTIDFVTDLPKVKARGSPWALPGFEWFDTLAPTTDKFSKKVILLPGHTTYGAKEWAIVLIRAFQLADWGLPRRIISDRDPKFISAVWTAIFRTLGVKLLLSTAYHPQTDGQSERTNQTAEIAIRFQLSEYPETPWPEVLPALQHNLNNSYTATIGRSPNEVVYGFKPRSTLDVIAEKDAPTESIDVIRKIYQDEAAALIDIANSLRKERYDKKHSDVRFSVGDEVWIRLGKGFHLPGQRHNKWTSRRMGPFRIVRIVSPTAYEVDLPAHWRIFPILSVAQLYKPAQGDDPFNREQQPPQPIEVDGSEEWEIDHIVSRRINRRKREPRIEYLVRWKGFTARFDTWELRESLETNAAELVNEYEARYPVDAEVTPTYRSKRRQQRNN
ncbi:uncharacterized protein CTRU02_207743 [Colletotrichum truncatum]|uniref:Uncharacterized protein n=1 Tax=Colletotrichum truncatum TaxID=5467 RepID=A0ACC3Z1P0_COLTU